MAPIDLLKTFAFRGAWKYSQTSEGDQVMTAVVFAGTVILKESRMSLPLDANTACPSRKDATTAPGA